jgi:hypothetical protein
MSAFSAYLTPSGAPLTGIHPMKRRKRGRSKNSDRTIGTVSYQYDLASRRTPMIGRRGFKQTGAHRVRLWNAVVYELG